MAKVASRVIQRTIGPAFLTPDP